MGRQSLHVSFEEAVDQSVYDPLTGRLVERRFFDNLASYANGAGTPAEVWAYTYDAFGREASVTQTAGAAVRTVVNQYDALGRLTSVDAPEGVLAYTYDDLGRRTRTALFAPGDDPAVDAPQRTTSFTYDVLGRLRTVVEDRDASLTTDPLVTTAYAYDLAGNLGRVELPGGVLEEYAYDSLGRLDTLTQFLDVGLTNGRYDALLDTLIASYDYTVRADGRRSAVTETFGDGPTNEIAWTYDTLGRLTGEDFDSTDNSLDYVHAYTYDLAGNRLTWAKDTDHDSDVDETVTYEYDANDRLITESLEANDFPGAEQVTTYGYGHTQQTSKTIVQGAILRSKITHAYDLQGRLASAVTELFSPFVPEVTDRTRVEYAYDARGLRVSAVESTDTDLNGSYDRLDKTTAYLVDHENHTGYQQVVRETRIDEQTDESTVIDYSFGHDELTQTTRTYDDEGTLEDEATYTFTHDGHGSVRVLTGEFGVPVETYAFDAYGNAHGFDASTALTGLLYSGEFFEATTGLQYLRARWYNPTTGRLEPTDPFIGNNRDPQSLHKYLYTHADPVNGIDPTGREFSITGLISATSIGGVVGGLIGGAVAATRERTWRSVAIGALYGAATGAVVMATVYTGAWGASRLIGPPGPFTSPTTLQTGLRSFSRFFSDSRTFNAIRQGYWARFPNGAAGRSLHHWLIPQRWTWVSDSIRNAGFNLLNMPGLQGLMSRSAFFNNGVFGLNQWMGMTISWGGSKYVVGLLIENGVRILIPVSIAGTAAGVTGLADWAQHENQGEQVAIPGGGMAVPLDLTPAQWVQFEAEMVEQLEKARDEE